MSFLTVQYLGFLGVLFLAYYILGAIDKKVQWILLLIASYIFYGFYSVKYMAFLIFSTLVTWGAAIGISENYASEKAELKKDPSLTREQKKTIRSAFEKKRKCWILFAVVLDVGLLVLMKYANYGIDSFNRLFGLNAPRLQWVVLPLGFSFYTFQSLGYCIDVYRGSVEAQRNLLKYALFVSFFPQLCEGPIGNYAELSPQLLEGHRFEYDHFVKGLIRILIGIFKKVVIADRLALFIDPIYANYAWFSGSALLLATCLYSFQLYADFSGYIDIALGTGECLGIRLMENFSTPYFSHSITEFWRRWHISLGAWFRNYLYYPVLRSRAVSTFGKKLSKEGKKKLASALTATAGLVVTWTVIGMWHGAGLKYLLYGWYHGFFVILAVWMGDAYKKAKETLHIRENNAWKLFQIARTFLIVTFGYVIFRADFSMEGVRAALGIYRRIFTAFYYKDAVYDFMLLTGGEWIVILFGVAAVFAFDVIERKTPVADWICGRKPVLRWAILYVLLWITMLFFLDRPADAGNFIYFDF